MEDFEPRRPFYSRYFIASTYFVFMTSSLIFNLIGLSSAQISPPPLVWISYPSNSTNQTEECRPCSKSEDSDTSVGVIIGSAIAGAIIGAVVTAAVMTFLRNRSLSPPPKDYDGRDDQVRFDVNRNDDVTTLTNGGDRDVEEEGSDPRSTKGHKKLERLVQRNPYQKPGDLNTTEMAAVPLIHNTDSSTLTSATAAATDTTSTTTSPSSSSHPFIKTPTTTTATTPTTPTTRSGGSSSGHRTYHHQQQQDHKDDDPGYLNVGDKSPLEQPYDSLAIVPEEVEYENQKQNVYEPILSDIEESRA